MRVEVRDQGGPWTPPALTDPGEQNGRGLAIVSQLAHAWGRSGGEAGWTVWFEIGQDPAQRWITLLDGHRLRRLRHSHGLTQAELAAKAGLSNATVARLEASTCPACRCRTLARLAAALGADPALTARTLPGRAGAPRARNPSPRAASLSWLRGHQTGVPGVNAGLPPCRPTMEPRASRNRRDPACSRPRDPRTALSTAITPAEGGRAPPRQRGWLPGSRREVVLLIPGRFSQPVNI